MADRPRKALFPNPFYLLLITASTVFVLTALGYLVSPNVQQQAAHRPGAGPASLALADWLDRNAPTALAVEFAVMLVAGLLAMATDRWFPSRPASKVTRTD